MIFFLFCLFFLFQMQAVPVTQENQPRQKIIADVFLFLIAVSDVCGTK